MRTKVAEAGLDDLIVVDSAGTHDYNVGAAPDPRAQEAARRRGYELGQLRARQVSPQDFEQFDLILAMDFANLERLQTLCPPEHRQKIGLLMPYATRRRALIVHDPYSRSLREFELALDYIEDACMGLLETLEPEVSALAPGMVRPDRARAPLPDRPAGGSGLR